MNELSTLVRVRRKPAFSNRFSNTSEMYLTEQCDEKSSERVKHQISNGVIEAVLSQRHCHPGCIGGDIQSELEELPDDAKREDDNEDVTSSSR